MNIAIIIGVSKYSNPNDNLPGSRNDAESINAILKKTEKFDDILYINNEENSAQTKELITNFISQNKGKPINEFFYYYSGHGEFTNDEFFYILSDFDPKKRNQTSLQNKEVDDLIKTLSPTIVIKVVDACQSGTLYIKEIGVLNKYFTDSQKGFQKCYFLNSSLNSQSSYADNKISFFTASFISAIKEHKSDEIRYKDIIDVIADEFSGNQDQTPLFIIQADFTEKFCFITQDLKKYVSDIIDLESNLVNSESKSLSLSELVRLDAQNYTNRAGAINALILVQEKLYSFSLNEILKDLYDVEIVFSQDHGKIKQLHVVKKWLDTNINDYFTTPIYEERYDDIVGQYDELIGFDLNIEVPFKAASIEFNAKYPNILSYHSNILYFISKQSIRFFYFTTNYIDKNWDEKQLNTKSIKWFTTDYKIGIESEVVNGIEQLLISIQKEIEKDLERKFEISEDKEQTEDQKKENNDDDDLPF